jgi:DNA-binding MarR family transcriptional regulator
MSREILERLLSIQEELVVLAKRVLVEEPPLKLGLGLRDLTEQETAIVRAIGRGQLTPKQIAEAIDVAQNSIYDRLRTLVVAGVLTRSHGLYSVTPQYQEGE